MNQCYFDDWCKDNHGQPWQGIKNDLIVDGLDEEAIEDHFQDLSQEFEEHCDNHDLQAEYV